MPLAPDRVRAFYDRFGARQDAQGFYEDAAVRRLIAAADFATAASVLEFGCGTGRMAAEILSAHPGIRYTGLDVSATMVTLARERLAPWGERASVVQVPSGSVTVPQRADRIVSTYVLDLLSEPEIRQFLAAARNAITPGGKLCLASLTQGPWLLPRLVSGAWHFFWRVRPGLMGGCRPIQLRSFAEAEWAIEHSSRVTAWGITSEVLVLRPNASSTG